ncbi:MAG: acyl-CoA dehydrogenase [Desulfovibrionales bacterium GWA2_65_9]|nr:MAG: acyl-CoA dehydrogenase [Desulfovibrionales bacterium GWA2_65_9]HLC26873.1 acyl-CoA dehydrogenase family protein [bacterium]
MDFHIPDEMKMLQQTVRRFVEEKLEPISARVEEEDRIPDKIVDEMKELGLFGLSIPEEYGGLGLGMLGNCLVFEELSKTNFCFRTRISTNNGLGVTGLMLSGTPEQKKRYLPRLARGELMSAFALSEPSAGSDAANIRTMAVRRGDHYVLNGTKHFITNGDIADLVTVLAVTDPAKGPRGGITSFLVEKGTSGFSVGRIDRKMGQRGSNTCELVFEDCRVPAESVLGREGDGFQIAMKVLDRGRLNMASCCVGSAQKLLELSTQYATERVQFGKPIAEQQAVQIMLADSATEIYAGRMMVYNAACLKDQGEEIRAEASMAKLFCSEMANRVADRALQIYGGMGYMKDFPIERFFRDLRLTRIYEGTSEIQHLIIARELLKKK